MCSVHRVNEIRRKAHPLPHLVHGHVLGSREGDRLQARLERVHAVLLVRLTAGHARWGHPHDPKPVRAHHGAYVVKPLLDPHRFRKNLKKSEEFLVKFLLNPSDICQEPIMILNEPASNV